MLFGKKKILYSFVFSLSKFHKETVSLSLSLTVLPLIFLWHTHGLISITATSHWESHITTTSGALRCDPPLS